MTITENLQIGEDIERYGYWATYAMLRGYGETRPRALWMIWVAGRTNAYRIKFRM